MCSVALCGLCIHTLLMCHSYEGLKYGLGVDILAAEN